MNPRPKLRIASSIVAFAMIGWLAIAPPATAAPSDVTIQVVRAAGQVCVWGMTLAEIRLDGTPIGAVTNVEPCPNLNPNVKSRRRSTWPRGALCRFGRTGPWSMT